MVTESEGKGDVDHFYSVFPEGYHGDKPLLLRKNSTDELVYRQVWEHRCYDFPLGEPQSGQQIVDGGAYTGISTAWFAQRYPHLRVFAIEPDLAHYELLRKNTLQYPNVDPFRMAIWHEFSKLILRNPAPPNGDWAKSFEPGVIGTVEGFPLTRIVSSPTFIVKLDIEGAEHDLFSSPRMVEPWLKLTQNLLIESHSNATTRRIKSVMSQLGWQWERKGEIWHFRREDEQV